MPMPQFRRGGDNAAAAQMSAEHNTTPRQPSPAQPAVRTNKYPGACVNCGATVPAEKGSLSKVGDKWVIAHLNGCDTEAPAPEPEHEVNVVNGEPLYDGVYTYETETAYRTFRLRTQDADADFMPGVQILQHLTGPDNSRDYDSFGHVKNGRLYIWKRFQDRTTLVADAQAFFADPQAALPKVQCFRCHRDLTVPASIHNGLGPECAKKGI